MDIWTMATLGVQIHRINLKEVNFGNLWVLKVSLQEILLKDIDSNKPRFELISIALLYIMTIDVIWLIAPVKFSMTTESVLIHSATKCEASCYLLE